MDLQYPGNQHRTHRRGRRRDCTKRHAVRRQGHLLTRADSDTCGSLVERASLAAAGRRRGLAPTASEGPNAEGGRIVAVMSPKGGVGKTTIASNLAIGLGQIAPMSVVIVDLDLQFGDVASGLMLEPGIYHHRRGGGRSQPGLNGPQDLPVRASGQHLRPVRAAQPHRHGQDHW